VSDDVEEDSAGTSFPISYCATQSATVTAKSCVSEAKRKPVKKPAHARVHLELEGNLTYLNKIILADYFVQT
jgi:hypothetical protein